MTMPAKEAAKVLREHVEIRRKAGTGNPCLNQAIDAAVVALEAAEANRVHNHGDTWREPVKPSRAVMEQVIGHPSERAQT